MVLELKYACDHVFIFKCMTPVYTPPNIAPQKNNIFLVLMYIY